ncbi:hypothetical protein HanIR_Chr16g0833921 [Helianthus annuus]|nr:hypothetical protein HanIR_Chr16g0833921 [Helianthus annuus]
MLERLRRIRKVIFSIRRIIIFFFRRVRSTPSKDHLLGKINYFERPTIRKISLVCFEGSSQQNRRITLPLNNFDRSLYPLNNFERSFFFSKDHSFSRRVISNSVKDQNRIEGSFNPQQLR